MADEKDQYRLNLQSRLTEAVDGVLRKRGLSRTEGVKRLFEWFLEQPQVIQAAILGHLPEDFEQDIAKMVLEKMAQEDTLPNGVSSGSVGRG